MKEKTKLIIGICLPLVIILFVIGSALLPQLFFHPKYDFVYTVDPYCTNYDYNCNAYGYSQWLAYKVVDGKVVKETTMPVPFPNRAGEPKMEPVQVVYPKLYKYSVANDSFQTITLEDAQKLSLTDSGSAPDGTTVSNDYTSGGGLIGEILGGNSRYGLYLRNGVASKKIIVQNGNQDDYYARQNFHLIGWIK